MIYTVTCNPSLDYIVSVDDFRLGQTNRTSCEQMLPGGKGINVSIVLKNLGIESTALGFAAGFTGKELVRRVEEMGIKSDFIYMEEGFSRINLKLKSIDGTEINGCGPVVSGAAMDRLMARLNRAEDGDVLVLAGSIPGSMPDDTYRKIAERLTGKKVLLVVDATKNLLSNVLECHPFLVKPNHHELGELFDTRIENREEAVPYAERLRGMGAANVLVSMAGEGAVLAAGDGRIYAAPAPPGKPVNSVGAGDSMVAGFLAGWLEKNDYRHAFYMGLAAGSATAFTEGFAAREEIVNLYRQISPH